MNYHCIPRVVEWNVFQGEVPSPTVYVCVCVLTPIIETDSVSQMLNVFMSFNAVSRIHAENQIKIHFLSEL